MSPASMARSKSCASPLVFAIPAGPALRHSARCRRWQLFLDHAGRDPLLRIELSRRQPGAHPDSTFIRWTTSFIEKALRGTAIHFGSGRLGACNVPPFRQVGVDIAIASHHGRSSIDFPNFIVGLRRLRAEHRAAQHRLSGVERSGRLGALQEHGVAFRWHQTQMHAVMTLAHREWHVRSGQVAIVDIRDTPAGTTGRFQRTPTLRPSRHRSRDGDRARYQVHLLARFFQARIRGGVSATVLNGR